MPKKFLSKGQPALGRNSQGGALPILILLAAVGMLGFLLISNTASFRDQLFARLFPKPTSQASQQAPSVPDEILMKFKPGVPENAKENIRNSHGLKVDDVITQIGVEKVKVAPQARDRVIEALNNNPNIEYAEPNYIVQELLTPNDTGYIGQWALKKIQAAQAWDITTGSSSIVVAVIDSGLYTEHEDIKGKVWLNSDETAGNGIDDDNNGFIDDVNGWNFYGNNNNIGEGTGHGTGVSGVIGAATNNGKGIAAISWQSPIMPIRVTDDSGFGTYANMANAINYAADNGVKVINMSLGGDSDS